jgi:hypothetical protein
MWFIDWLVDVLEWLEDWWEAVKLARLSANHELLFAWGFAIGAMFALTVGVLIPFNPVPASVP